MVLFALLSFLSGCVAGPWRGRVIDSETKGPIEGAAVVAVWYGSRLTLDEGSMQYFSDARETVTDKDGRFELPAYKYNPTFQSKNPKFTIFKPGYGAFPLKSATPEGLDSEYFTTGGGLVELPKLKTRKERLDTLVHLGYFNFMKTPNLFRYREIESKDLGLR
ncbi:MAG: carboxypeptidase-like regulatory domain-containing protein [Nitrospirota bacterium]